MTKLIKDCLEQIIDNPEVKDKVNYALEPYELKFDHYIWHNNNTQSLNIWKPELHHKVFEGYSNIYKLNVDTTEEATKSFLKLPKYWLVLIIQTLLSRVDGKAVMEFLDVESEDYQALAAAKDIAWQDGMKRIIQKQIDITPRTLDHLLYKEFTEALRIGKSLDETLEIINNIYIENI